MRALSEILTESATIAVDDGTTMSAYAARPDGDGPHPAIVVAAELFGVTAHARDICERLAREGHLAIAPDLYHRTAPHTELPHDPAGRERGFDLLHRMTRPEVVADVRAAVGYVRAGGAPRVGMFGVSVGGHVAYLAATELDLDAVAVAYGGWLPGTGIPIGRPEPTLAGTPRITARVLALYGEDDHAIPEADRTAVAAALADAGIRHEFVTYPGVAHGFLCDRRDTYDKAAAEDAWRRVLGLFTAELIPAATASGG
ncbi:MAG TPA: dienelactone hydrolase family protein [Streptosporangiaceae bacterium]|jgi:carboxymethylenebutenolidase